MTSTFAGDGTELVSEVAGGGKVWTGVQDAVELFALAVCQASGRRMIQVVMRRGLGIGCGGSGMAVQARSVAMYLTW